MNENKAETHVQQDKAGGGEYSLLMEKELRSTVDTFREDGGGIAVFPWPTGSGKSYQTRKMHFNGILHEDEVLVLSYPTMAQCKSTLEDLKDKKKAHPEIMAAVRPTILIGQDAQVEKISEEIVYPKSDEKEKLKNQQFLIQTLSDWFQGIQGDTYTDTQDYRALHRTENVKETIRYWLENTELVYKWNKQLEKGNDQEHLPVMQQKQRQPYTDFRRLYRLIWMAVRSMAEATSEGKARDKIIAREIEITRQIPDIIMDYFPDFVFEYSNILICSHAKLFRSLVTYRDFYLVNGDSRGRQRPYFVVIDEEEAFNKTYDQAVIDEAKRGAVSINSVRRNLGDMANPKSHWLDTYLYDRHVPKDDQDTSHAIQAALQEAVPGRFPLLHCAISNDELTGQSGKKDAETGLPKYVQLPQHTFRCGRNFYIKEDPSAYLLYLARPKKQDDEETNEETSESAQAEPAPGKGKQPNTEQASSSASSESSSLPAAAASVSADAPATKEKADAPTEADGKKGDALPAEGYLSEYLSEIHRQRNIGARLIRQIRVTSDKRHDPKTEYAPQTDMMNAIRNSVAPDNPAMQAYWNNTIYPMRALHSDVLKADKDWYQIGLSLHFVDTENDLPTWLHAQRADIHTIQIPATANGFLRFLTERVAGVILLSATAEIRSMDNVDRPALKPYLKTPDPDELMEIQRLYWKERESEYRDTELDRILVLENDPGGQDYARVVTGPAAEAYAERAVRGVLKHGITHGICFGLALSAKWNPTPTNAGVFSADTIRKKTNLPETYTVKIWLFSAQGIQDVSEAGAKEVPARADTWTLNGDTYTFHVRDREILFLLTAYRSADRGFNFEVESSDGKTWALAGMCCMRQTNTVPVKSDGYVTEQTYDTWEREYWAETTYAAMKQIRMQTGETEPTPAEGWHMAVRYVQPIVRNRLVTKQDKSSASEKKRAGWSAVSGDYYKNDDMSPFKLTNAAAYEQAIGRIRGGKDKRKPEYMLLGMMASCISRNEYGPSQIGRIHSYESERVWLNSKSWNEVKKAADDMQEEVRAHHDTVCGLHSPFGQGNAAERMWNDIKVRIPAAKRMYASALLSGDEKKQQRAYRHLTALARTNEDRKDACCHMMESLEADIKSGNDHDKSRFRAFFCYGKSVYEPFDPFTWHSYRSSTESGDKSNTQVRRYVPGEANPSPFTPNRMFIPQLIRILRKISPDACRAAFPALSEATAARMEQEDCFPFPPAVCAYTMIAGEVGERVFFGVYEELKAQGRTSLSIVRMSDLDDSGKRDYMYLYEDYDVFVFDSDVPETRKLIGAINIKNAWAHDHEKSEDVLKQKIDRFHQAAGDAARMRVAYVDVRPGDKHTDLYTDMGNLPVDVCSTGMFSSADVEADAAVELLIRDAENTFRELETFFQGEKS